MGNALLSFTSVFGQAPGLAQGVKAEFILEQWHALFADADEAAFKAAVRAALKRFSAFPVPAQFECLMQGCACFQGTCRGGEVTDGRLANGVRCRVCMPAEQAETQREAAHVNA